MIGIMIIGIIIIVMSMLLYVWCAVQYNTLFSVLPDKASRRAEVRGGTIYKVTQRKKSDYSVKEKSVWGGVSAQELSLREAPY